MQIEARMVHEPVTVRAYFLDSGGGSFETSVMVRPGSSAICT